MRLSQTFPICRGGTLRFKEHVFSGEATPLPGSTDIVVSHGVYSHSGGGTGCGKKASETRLKQFKDLGYSACLCTVNLSNAPQLKILKDTGWEMVFTYNSKRTKNLIGVFMKELK